MSNPIDELRRAEVEAAEAGDVEALLALRSEDFVAMPPGQPPVRGKEDVRAFLESMFSGVSVRETVTSESVVVGRDLAYDRGIFSGTATIEETGASVPLDGKYLWVVKKVDDGSWLYSVQMWSHNQEPNSS